MEKKYQVFISSTYLDLKDERQAVSKSILDLGHIPSGMELFPATNASQIDYIKKVIDDCDFYLIIVGGRYGSLGPDGMSFTEQEYSYAVERGLPVLAFIHGDIDSLPLKNSERMPELIDRLLRFREKLQERRLTKYWSNLGDLQAAVITSLTSEFRDNPQTGWRRDTGELSAEARKELESAKKSYKYWYAQHNLLEEKVKSYEDLQSSVVEIRFQSDDGANSIDVSAEEVIRELAFPLSRGTHPQEIHDRLLSMVKHKRDSSIKELDSSSVFNVKLFLEVFEITNPTELADSEIKIRDNKKYLLKAAFKPLKAVLDEKGYDDEIPF